MPIAIVAAIAAVVGLALGPPLMLMAQRLIRGERKLGWPAWAAASLATAVLFAAVILAIGLRPELAAYLALAAAGVVLSTVDLVEKRIPNGFLLATTVLVVVLLLIAAAASDNWSAAFYALLGAVIFFGIYFAIALISPRSMGFGDVKLAFVLGAATGFLGWNAWVIALFAGVLVGGIVALTCLISGRVNMRTFLPYGPSMILGAFFGIVTGS